MSLESTASDSTGFGLAKINGGGPNYAVLCKKVSKSGLKKKRVKANVLIKQRCGSMSTRLPRNRLGV